MYRGFDYFGLSFTPPKKHYRRPSQRVGTLLREFEKLGRLRRKYTVEIVVIFESFRNFYTIRLFLHTFPPKDHYVFAFFNEIIPIIFPFPFWNTKERSTK